MSVKKLGKAQWDSKTEMWRADGRGPSYMVNRRLIDTRPEIKALRSQYSKEASRNKPTVRKREQRAEYETTVDALRKAYIDGIKAAFEELKKESFEFPILLRMDRDYDHTRDWRHCLFEGNIYQLDRTGYSDEDIVRQIRALERPKEPKGESSE